MSEVKKHWSTNLWTKAFVDAVEQVIAETKEFFLKCSTMMGSVMPPGWETEESTRLLLLKVIKELWRLKFFSRPSRPAWTGPSRWSPPLYRSQGSSSECLQPPRFLFYLFVEFYPQMSKVLIRSCWNTSYNLLGKIGFAVKKRLLFRRVTLVHFGVASEFWVLKIMAKLIHIAWVGLIYLAWFE